jgi:PKD repeat protein
MRQVNPAGTAIALICILPLLLLTPGCGKHDAISPLAPAATAHPPAGIGHALPAPSVLPKSASAAAWRVRPGGWFSQLPPYSMQLVTAFSGSAIFQPDYDPASDPPQMNFAFCMYAFNALGLGTQPAEVRHGWATPPATWGDLWWGLANWDKDRWDWYPATGAMPQVLGAPTLDAYTADDGRIVLCMLLLGKAQAQLNWIAVGGNLPPDASYEIDPADPIAGEPVSFSATSSQEYDGTIEQYEFDFGEGAGFEDYGANDSAEYTYEVAGAYTAGVRVTDNGGLTDTELFVINVGAAAHDVIASLSADPPGGSPIVTIEFDASASLPSTGAAITAFDFDFNGDGVIDQSGVSPTGYHTFDWATDCTAAVTVTDDTGKSATATVPLSLADERNWNVEFQASCGETFALVNAGGCPALAYNTSDYAQIFFVQASDALGATWPAPVLIDGLGPFNGRMDAEVIDGKPSLAYIRLLTEEELYVRYAHSSDETGMLDGHWSAVDAAPMGYLTAANHTLDLIPVGIGAGIAFHTRIPAAVQFIRSLDAAGNSWASPVKVDDVDLISANCLSACLISGKPAIAYASRLSPTQTVVYYKQATDALGAAFGAANTVLSEASHAFGVDGICLNQQDGVLAVVADYTNSGEVRFAYPDPGNPAEFINLNPLPWGFEPSQGCSWTMLAGNPAVLGYDSYKNALYLARASDQPGVTWPATAPMEIVAGDPDGTDIGRHPKMLIINGTPCVAYYDAGTEKVFVAVLR